MEWGLLILYDDKWERVKASRGCDDHQSRTFERKRQDASGTYERLPKVTAPVVGAVKTSKADWTLHHSMQLSNALMHHVLSRMNDTDSTNRIVRDSCSGRPISSLVLWMDRACVSSPNRIRCNTSSNAIKNMQHLTYL